MSIECDPAFSKSLHVSASDNRVTWSRIDVLKTIEAVPVPVWKWRMIDVQILGRKYSVWQWIYGTDIFLNGWPVLKIFAGLVLLGVWVISTL